MFLKNKPRTLRKNKNFTGRGIQKAKNFLEKCCKINSYL